MKKPRAVLISDIHFNLTTYKIAATALKLALNKAEKLKVPLIIAGDLHDTKSNLRSECVDELISILSQAEVQVRIIPGNHCKTNVNSDDHALNFLQPYADIISQPTCVDDLWFIPYQHDPDKLLQTLRYIPEGSTIIAHQGVQGAKMGHYTQDTSSLPREAYKDFRVISGHYHQAQDIKCGRPRKGAVGLFSFLGNPFTLNFGEANDGPKGYAVLYKDGSLERIPTNLRKHIVVERTVDDLYAPIKDYRKGDLLWIKVVGPKTELDRIRKVELSSKLGVESFKLDLYPSDSKKKTATLKVKKAPGDLLDGLIEDLSESLESKDALKALWRELQ